MKVFTQLTVLLASLVLSSTGSAALITINDASGRNGSDASNGTSFSKNAGQSNPGQSAKKVDLELVDQEGGFIQIRGRIGNRSYSRSISVGSTGKIQIIAKGGDGGDGGAGAKGDSGTDGSDGSDATQFSSGTDGSDGGPGGRGGNGSRGSDGGNGGEVTVTVSEKNMHLLYLVARPDVRGGKGGEAGRNGAGGDGGRGGSGGSSYSWTETVQGTCYKSVKRPTGGLDCKIIPQGDGSAEEVCTQAYEIVDEPYSCPKQESRSQSGGSNGSDGPRGPSGNANVSGGNNGNSGSYRYVVRYNNGTEGVYHDPFVLKLTGFTLRTQLSDSFAEPGEWIEISDFKVQNSGGMPSPIHTKVLIGLNVSPQGSAHPQGQSWIQIGSIEVGESKTFKDQKIRFKVKDILGKNNDSKNLDVGLYAHIQEINRYFPGFKHYTRNVQVRYPVELSGIRGTAAIAPSASSEVSWGVQNLANRALGNDNDSKRRVIMDVRIKGDSDLDGLFSVGTRDQPTITSEVSNLDEAQAGEVSEERHRTRIYIDSNAPAFSDGTVQVTLKVQSLERPEKFYTVETGEFKFTVGKGYEKDPGADVLLITNPATQRSEVQHWETLCERLGRKLVVWDISLYQRLDLVKDGILEDFEGGTLVLLNNLYDSEQGEVYADYFLRQNSEETVENLNKQNIGVLIWDQSIHFNEGRALGTKFSQRSVTDPMIVSYRPSKLSFHDKKSILSRDNILSFFLTLSFQDKVNELVYLVNQSSSNFDEEVALALVDALFADIAWEQVSMRDGEYPYWSWWGDKFQNDIRFLKHLSETLTAQLSLEATQEGNPGRTMMIDLLSKIEYLSQSQTNFARNRGVWGIDENMSEHSSLLVQNMVDHIFEAKDSGWGIAYHFSSTENQERMDRYDSVASEMKTRMKEIEEDVYEVESAYQNSDDGFFLFELSKFLNGNYYRRAMYQIALDPIRTRFYSFDPKVLKGRGY